MADCRHIQTVPALRHFYQDLGSSNRKWRDKCHSKTKKKVKSILN